MPLVESIKRFARSITTASGPTTEAQALAQAKQAASAEIAKQAAAPVVFDEQLITAYQNSSLYSLSGFPRYNPDVLASKKGLQIYDDMMVDEQVKAVMNFRRDAVTARKWSLRYEEGSTLDEAEQERRIQLLTKILKMMDGSLTDSFNMILKALRYGYSLTEKVYGFCDVDGQYQYCITSMQAKPLTTFWFECDPFGRITDFYQLVGGLRNSLDLKKFVYYVHNPEEDNIYGRSELRAAYRSWYSKDVIIRLWNLWMERMAGGFLAVTRDPAAQSVVPGTPEYLALTKALSSITTTTSMLLPSGFNVQMISPNNTDQYEAALSWHDRAIAKSQLVPNLLGVSDQGAHGALAQSTTQLEAFAWTLNNIQKRLEDCFNTQVIYDLCEQNFGDGQYPEFAFSAVTDAQLQWIIGSWKDLVGAKSVHVTPQDEMHLRKILDFPGIDPADIEAMDEKAKQDQIDLIKAKPAPAPGASQGSAFGRSGARSTARGSSTEGVDSFGYDPEEPRDEEGKWTDGGGGGAVDHGSHVVYEGKHFPAQVGGKTEYAATTNNPANLKPKKEAKAKAWEHANALKSAGRSDVRVTRKTQSLTVPVSGRGISISDTYTVYHGTPKAKLSSHAHGREPLIVSRQAYSRALLRVDFAVIDRSATKLADNGHADVARATARMLSRALTDERLSDREHIAQFGFDAMDVAKLRVACTNLLRDSWNLGAQEAGNEMAKAGRKEMRRKFAVSSTLDIAKAYLDSNSFRMAGNLSDGARSIIQQELVNALKGDKTFVETREAILDRLLRKGFTDLQSVGEFFPEDVHQALSEALGGEGYKGTDASYIDTLIRTNVFDAMNQGRLESFRDPDIGDFVQALEYASVLDDHTTEICTELNGATWSTDNPLWDTYMPPNHYNCRSVVIPITQVDGWDGQESPVPEVQPQDGFK